MRFTVERKLEGKTAFLNVMCHTVDGVVTVDVFRKPTHTMRLITSDSFHEMKHTMAAYHGMAHFVTSLPLDDQKIEIETMKIVDIGIVNGYKEEAIMKIIWKHQQKKQLWDMSTLLNTSDEDPKRVSIRYYPEITKLLRPVYRSFNIELVHRNDGSLKDALGTTKDVPPDLHKSGIYRIQCSCCGRYYFGMTIRKLFVRFNEHVNSARWKKKTAVGRHIFSSNHHVNISELKLIKPVRHLWKIEYFEAIHIHRHKHENLLNIDNGNVESPLLDLFVLERKVDTNVIDLISDTEDTLNSSMDGSFYDC